MPALWLPSLQPSQTITVGGYRTLLLPPSCPTLNPRPPTPPPAPVQDPNCANVADWFQAFCDVHAVAQREQQAALPGTSKGKKAATKKKRSAAEQASAGGDGGAESSCCGVLTC